MLDRILEVGCAFDWFSPLASVIGDLANGGGHALFVDIGASPYTGREIELYLRGRGVRTWGAMIVDGTLTLSVKRSQARWAEYLLESAGVPLESASTAPRPAPAPSAGIMQRSRIMQSLRRR